MAATPPHVVLLGDSTLDNVCWTGHPHEVPELLRARLPPGARVTNWAADGFNSTDLLHGAKPVISRGKRREIGDPFPDGGADDIFRPLELLASLEPSPTCAVVSIGGNDVREILSHMQKLQEIIKGFHKNYPAIIEKVRKSVPNVVLMFQYRPSFNMDGGGYGVYQAIEQIELPGDSIQKINSLMQVCYAPVIAAAREQGLPIVDLPRTFDIYDDELFCCQIEPSAKGGALIADLLAHVVQKHDFSGPSKFYLREHGEETAVLEEPNDGGRPWEIPRDAGPGAGKAAWRGLPVDDGAYKQLCSMGFEPARAVLALQECGNDLERAVAWLAEGR